VGADLQVDTQKLRTSDPAYTSTAAVSYPDAKVREGTLRLVREKKMHAGVRDLDDHLDDA